jgi:hypothetical protein
VEGSFEADREIGIVKPVRELVARMRCQHAITYAQGRRVKAVRSSWVFWTCGWP